MIPVNEPFIGEKEKKYVNECLDTGWISSGGRFIGLFEEKFAGYCQRKVGIAVNSGTNALIAAIRALGLPPGSEVIVPSFTIISCALACVYNGLTPVFVDSCPYTWTMDIESVRKKITPNTRVIMVVHIYGHPVDMDPILDIAKQHKIKIVEDFAEAIGSRYKGKICGSFGDVSCASFYGNKTVTTGEGGMCLTDDPKISAKVKSIRNLCFLPRARFVHKKPGFNFRMTNIQAALGLGQMERVEESVKKKIKIGQTYNQFLKELQNKEFLQLPVQKDWAENTYWMYGVLLNEKRGIPAEVVMEKMAEKDIQTRPFFFPMHQQPVFKGYAWYKEESLPVSEKFYCYGFYLPSGITLTTQQIQQVAETLKEVLYGI